MPVSGAIQLHTNLIHDVRPGASETLCGRLVDHEREGLPTPVHLERIDAHNCCSTSND